MSHFKFGQAFKNKHFKRTFSILALGSVLGYLHQNSNSKVTLFYEKTNEKINQIIDKCEDLQVNFRPTFWLKNHHLQTVYITLKKSPLKLPHETETFKLKDGSEIYLDWIQSSDNNENAPTIFILAGVVSGLHGCGIKDFVNYATHNGFRCVVFNYTNPKEREKFMCFNPGVTHQADDLDDLFDHIETKIPNSKLYGVGYSLGSNILVKYISIAKKQYFNGVVAVSNPFDLVVATRQLLTPVHSVLYDKFMLRDRIKIYANSRLKFDQKELENVKSTIELDTLAIKYTGHQTVEHFYTDHSCVYYLENIKIPLLCLNAKDDPISHHQSIPYEISKKNSNIILAVTENGGHLGFIEGFFPLFQQSWSERATLQFLKAVDEMDVKK
eukprot:gene8320-144_t